MQSKAHFDFRPAFLAVMFIDPVHGLLHLESAAHGSLGRIGHRHGGPEDYQDGIPDDLVNGAAMFMDNLDHGGKVMVQQGHHHSGLKLFGQGGEAAQIGHQQGNLALFAAQLEAFGQIQEHPHDVVAGVAAEGLPDKLVAALELSVQIDQFFSGVLQLTGHGVERGGEVPHEVDFLLQIARGDLLGLPGKVLEVRLQGLESVRRGHAATQRAGIQFPLGDLLHGRGEGGELDNEAVYIGDKLAQLVVGQVVRDGDWGRHLADTQVMDRFGNLIDEFLVNGDHPGPQRGSTEKRQTRSPVPQQSTSLTLKSFPV